MMLRLHQSDRQDLSKGHQELSEAAASRCGEVLYVGFKKRIWVPAFTFLIDVAAVETALLFGYLTRYGLTPWWPTNLTASSYAGLILGVLVVPVSYYLVGLHPGYGLGARIG